MLVDDGRHLDSAGLELVQGVEDARGLGKGADLGHDVADQWVDVADKISERWTPPMRSSSERCASTCSRVPRLGQKRERLADRLVGVEH